MVYPVNVYKNFFRVLDYQYLAEKWKRSLMSCQKKRGHAAHKFRGIATAYKTMTAQDAVEITVDAIELANYLKKKY